MRADRHRGPALRGGDGCAPRVAADPGRPGRGQHGGAGALAHDADPLVWSALLEQLLAAELLVPVEQPGPGAHPGRSRRAPDRRAVGAGPSARPCGRGPHHAGPGRRAGRRCAATSADRRRSPPCWPRPGVGHIHHEPAIRSQRRVPRPPAASPGGGPPRHAHAAAPPSCLREAFPTVRVHRAGRPPAPDDRVLAGGAVPDLGLAASLMRSTVPHLAVTAGVAARSRRAAGAARPIELPVLRASPPDGRRPGLAGRGQATRAGSRPSRRPSCRPRPPAWRSARCSTTSTESATPTHGQRHPGMAVR